MSKELFSFISKCFLLLESSISNLVSFANILGDTNENQYQCQFCNKKIQKVKESKET